MRDRVTRWVGIDRSPQELDVAKALGRGWLVAARADALPVAPGATISVVAAMSLMVLDDPLAGLAEVARVLGPDGRLAVLVPTGRPLTLRDRARYALLLAVLGRSKMPFPRLDVVRDPRRLLGAAGFDVIRHERARFALMIEDRVDATLFVESLYLPDVTARRVDAARRVVHRWRRRAIGVPLRRIVARPARTGAA